jgi:hypothetical protein
LPAFARTYLALANQRCHFGSPCSFSGRLFEFFYSLDVLCSIHPLNHILEAGRQNDKETEHRLLYINPRGGRESLNVYRKKRLRCQTYKQPRPISRVIVPGALSSCQSYNGGCSARQQTSPSWYTVFVELVWTIVELGCDFGEINCVQNRICNAG